jgi:hypothetical protein
MDSPNYRLSIQGVSKSIRALEEYAPDLKKALDKDIKRVLSHIVNEARGHIPFDIHPSGWARENKNAGLIGPLQVGKSRGSFVRFDAAKAKAGIKSVSPRSSKKTSGFRNSYGVIQRDAKLALSLKRLVEEAARVESKNARFTDQQIQGHRRAFHSSCRKVLWRPAYCSPRVG